MNDMSSVIVPKSDQINADDLIAGPRTITIRDVQIRSGQEQPVSIYFEGSDKAFRPCKSMSRVLVACWGADARNYVGRSLTLYRDPTVKWGGMEVGGIRISHMSNIDAEKILVLTATKGQRKPFVVKPLEQSGGRDDPAARWAATFIAKVKADPAGATALVSQQASRLADLRQKRPELAAEIDAAVAAAVPLEGPADTDRGERVTLAQALDELRMGATAEEVENSRRGLELFFDGADLDELRRVAGERLHELGGER